MEPRYYTGEPDARDDYYEHDGHMRLSAAQQYECACRALLHWIAEASNPAVPLWAAYRGDAQHNAIWYAKHCYREARRRGLYPTMAQLEAEHREAA